MSIPLLQNGPSNGQLSASLVREPLITALLEGHFSKVCVKEIKYPIIYLPEKWYWCGIHLITCQIHFRKEEVQDCVCKDWSNAKVAIYFWKSVDSD